MKKFSIYIFGYFIFHSILFGFLAVSEEPKKIFIFDNLVFFIGKRKFKNSFHFIIKVKNILMDYDDYYKDNEDQPLLENVLTLLQESLKEKISLANFYAEILNTVSELENPQPIIEHLKLGIKALKEPTNTEFPHALFGEDAITLIIGIARKGISTDVSIIAWKFLENVLVSNNDFQIDVFKNIGIDVVSEIYNHVSDEKTTTEEKISCINILANISSYDYECRDHVSEIFPLDVIIPMLIDDYALLPSIALLFKALVKFEADNDLYFTVQANIVFDILDEDIFIDTDTKVTLLESVFICITTAGATEIFSSAEEVGTSLMRYLFEKDQRLPILSMNIVKFCYETTYDDDIFDSFDISVIIEILFNSMRKIQKNCLLIRTALKLLTSIVSRSEQSWTQIMLASEEMQIALYISINNGTFDIKKQALKLCLAMIHDSHQDEIDYFIKNDFVETIFGFLDIGIENIQYNALFFINILVLSSMSNPDGYEALQEMIEPFINTLEELADEENEEISQKTIDILSLLYPSDNSSGF